MVAQKYLKARFRVIAFLFLAVLVGVCLYALWVLCWPVKLGASNAYLTSAKIGPRTVLIVDATLPVNLLGHAQKVTYGFDESSRSFWIDIRVALLALPPLWHSEMNFPVAIDPRASAWTRLHGKIPVTCRNGVGTIGYVYFDDGEIVRVENKPPFDVDIPFSTFWEK